VVTLRLVEPRLRVVDSRYVNFRDIAPRDELSEPGCDHRFVSAQKVGESAIYVARRTLIQDLLRCHTVFIDDEPRGKLWAFQTGIYGVTPGRHHVRLGIQPRIEVPWSPSGPSSAEIEIEVAADEARHLRTTGRGLSSFLSPRALLRRPWIILEVRDDA
jgi:hypothetical protein